MKRKLITFLLILSISISLFSTDELCYGVDNVFLSSDGNSIAYETYNNVKCYYFDTQNIQRLTYQGVNSLLVGNRIYFIIEHMYW